MTENEIGKSVVDIAVQIHRELGPGLLESVYEIAMTHQLRERGYLVERQVSRAIEYRGHKFDEGSTGIGRDTFLSTQSDSDP